MNVKKLLAVALLSAAVSLQASEYYVAPSSVPTGDGSMGKPWDLQTALNHPASVKPGDTIWLRGGVHRLSNRITKFVSRLAGASGQPITVRAYPGERVSIDGNIQQVTGGWVNYWGFEIYNSNPNRYTDETGPFPRKWWVTYDGKEVDLCSSGFDLQAPNVKLINLLVHDSIGGGFGINRTCQDAEVYGCLSFYNGWQASDRAHGHGIYEQNAAPYTKIIKDNLVFANLGLGMQNTGAGPEAQADNLRLEGSAFFMNGILAKNHQANLLIGAFQGVGRNSVIANNFIYDTMGSMSDCNIGYTGGLVNSTVKDNYFGTSVLFSSANSGLTLTGNTFCGPVNNLSQASYPNNTYRTPTENMISVRPNQYEKGRANIIIYNWQKLTSVTANISSIGLNVGDQYELHNAADFYGDVLTGTYDGSPITIPMTGHTVMKPIGLNLPVPPSTFPAFGAFVIMKKGGSTSPGTNNTAPTVTSVSAQTISPGTASSSIAFTVGDAQTAAGSLTVTAASSNPTLIPNANIVLGGSGANRTMTITPAAGQTGTATVTLTVSDGTASASTSFPVTVGSSEVAISSIANQTVALNTATKPIAFTVNNATSTLALTATSSSLTLVPEANIVLGGSGTSRTVTVTPAKDQSGTATITIKAGTASTSFGLTVTAGSSTNTPPGPETNNPPAQVVKLSFEAESGAVVSPMTVASDATTPTLKYIKTAANSGTATYKVNATSAGTYVVWCKVLATNYTCDSVFVSMDGAEDVYDMAEGKQSANWQWTKVTGRAGGSTPAALNPRTFNLSQGEHTLVIRGREANAMIDRIIVCNDLSYVPSDSETSNTAPTISSVSAQTVAASGTSNPIAFTVGDAQTEPGSLTVTAASSDVNLIPNANIVLGGSGANRTATITPAAGRSGSTMITLKVSDGTATASSSFSVTVDPAAVRISSIANQSIAQNSATKAIPFTVSNAPAGMTLTANSSSLTLVPVANIALGGSGVSRTVTVTPAKDQSGTATITLNAGTASTSFVLTVVPSSSTNNPPSTNPPSTSTNLVTLSFEAETGTLVAPMTSVSDPKMPTRKFIRSMTANGGTATYKVNIPKTDTYVMWCNVLATNYASDSVFVSVDGIEDVYDEAEDKQSTDWQWTQVNGRAGTGTPGSLSPRTFNLTQGQHTIVIRGREAGAMIDRIMLCNDASYSPSEIAAKNDTVSALPTGVTQIDPAELLANDSSAFADVLKVTAVGEAQTGTVALTTNMINYTAKEGFTGDDSFTYTITNGMGGSATGTVTVKVGTSTSVRLGFEAESGTLVAPMIIKTNAQSADSKYIWSTGANQGTATYTLDIPKAGDYRLWCKILATSYTSDSYFVSVDGTEDVFDAAEGTQSPNWQWVQLNGRGTTGTPKSLNPRILKLSQGTHTIVVRGREACAALDRMVISDDAAYVPKDIVAVADAVTAYANAPKQIPATDLVRNDFSSFDEPFQIKSVGTAKNGTVVLESGSVTYTPKTDFVGTDTFTYTVSDTQGNSATGTVTVTVK